MGLLCNIWILLLFSCVVSQADHDNNSTGTNINHHEEPISASFIVVIVLGAVVGAVISFLVVSCFVFSRLCPGVLPESCFSPQRGGIGSTRAPYTGQHLSAGPGYPAYYTDRQGVVIAHHGDGLTHPHDNTQYYPGNPPPAYHDGNHGGGDHGSGDHGGGGDCGGGGGE